MTTHAFKDVKINDVITLAHHSMPDFRLTGKVVLAEHDLNYDYGIMLEGISTRFYAETGFVIESHEKHIEKPLEKTPLKFKRDDEWCVGVYSKTLDRFVGITISGDTYTSPSLEYIEDWQYL